LLILERFAATQFNWRPSGWAGIALSFVLVTIGWVFFRAPTLADAWQYLSAMFYFGAGNESRPLAVYLIPDIQLYLAIGLFFAFAPFETLWRLRFDRPPMMMQQLGLSIVSLIYSSLLLATNSFNPSSISAFDDLIAIRDGTPLNPPPPAAPSPPRPAGWPSGTS
jgi:alginate O-acetyltransferase complex protein AlgI